MQHGLVIFGLLFPSDQAPAKAIHPAMSPLDAPTMGFEVRIFTAVRLLFTVLPTVRKWVFRTVGNTKFIVQFQQRCASESIRELRRHPSAISYSMVAMFCWRRRQQLTDALIEMLMVLIHNLGTRAEKKVDKKQFAAFKKVRGKARLLAEDHDGCQPVMNEFLFPL